MVAVHVVLAVAVLAVCVGAALYGFVAYRRGSAGATVAHALALAQTALIAQAAVGLLLLSDGRRAPDRFTTRTGRSRSALSSPRGSTRPRRVPSGSSGSPGRRCSRERSQYGRC